MLISILDQLWSTILGYYKNWPISPSYYFCEYSLTSYTVMATQLHFITMTSFVNVPLPVLWSWLPNAAFLEAACWSRRSNLESWTRPGQRSESEKLSSRSLGWSATNLKKLVGTILNSRISVTDELKVLDFVIIASSLRILFKFALSPSFLSVVTLSRDLEV